MGEIDYSLFYMSKRSEKNNKTSYPRLDEKISMQDKPKSTKEVEPNMRDRCAENPKENKRKMRKSNALIVVLILVCFLLTFSFAGLYSTGHVLGVFSSGNESGYFAVYKRLGDDYAEAERHSMLVRAGGGGGNIVKENNEYLVIYAVYLDEGSANSVADRSSELEVTSLTPTSWHGDSQESEEYTKLYASLQADLVTALYQSVIAYAQSGDDVALDSTIRRLTLECQELRDIANADDKLEKSEKLSLIVAIDTISGKIESISYADSGVGRLSNAWYQLYAIMHV